MRTLLENSFVGLLVIEILPESKPANEMFKPKAESFGFKIIACSMVFRLKGMGPGYHGTVLKSIIFADMI